MSHDYNYLDLIRDIIKFGIERTDRTGTGTIGLFCSQMTFNINDGTIPLLTTKKMHINSVVHELLWYIHGQTNIKYLNDNGVRIWNEWANQDGDLGPLYGKMWRAFPSISKYQPVKNTNPNKFEYVDKVCCESPFITDKVRDVIFNAWSGVIAEYGDNSLPKFETFILNIFNIKNWPLVFSGRPAILDARYYQPAANDSYIDVVWCNDEDSKMYDNEYFPLVVNSFGDISHYPSISDAAVGLGVSKDDVISAINSGEFSNGIKIKEFISDEYSIRYSTPVDQLGNIINTLKTNPTDRRMVLSCWHPDVLPIDKTPSDNVALGKQALPPCHYTFQFYATELNPDEQAKSRLIVEECYGESYTPKYGLSCVLHQRSADVGLGVPFNIAQYSILTHMVAKVVGMAPWQFIWSGGDVHIYKNHVDALSEQINRSPMASPKISLSANIGNINDYKFKDINIVNYASHPTIKLEVSV